VRVKKKIWGEREIYDANSGRITGKSEAMQTAEAFPRMPSGRDSGKTPGRPLPSLRPRRAASGTGQQKTSRLSRFPRFPVPIPSDSPKGCLFLPVLRDFELKIRANGVSRMPKYKVTFHEAIQDSQTFGSNDEHMVSRVFFSLVVDGERAGNFYANLKQTVGTEFNSSDIEVSPPHEYDGPLDYAQFSEAARDYFSRQFGTEGSAIRFSGGGNIRMRDNRSQQEREYDF